MWFTCIVLSCVHVCKHLGKGAEFDIKCLAYCYTIHFIYFGRTSMIPESTILGG